MTSAIQRILARQSIYNKPCHQSPSAQMSWITILHALWGRGSNKYDGLGVPSKAIGSPAISIVDIILFHLPLFNYF